MRQAAARVAERGPARWLARLPVMAALLLGSAAFALDLQGHRGARGLAPAPANVALSLTGMPEVCHHGSRDRS